MKEINRKRNAWKLQIEKVNKWLKAAMWLALFNLCTCLISFATPSLLPNLIFVLGFLCWCGIEIVIWKMNKKKKQLFNKLMEEYNHEDERSRTSL